MAGPESMQRTLALALVAVAVDRSCLDSALAQYILELVALPFGLNKHQNQTFRVC